MLRFCANLSFLFLEEPFPRRFHTAAASGFRGVEFMSPYDYAAAEIAAWAQAADVEVVLFNLPAGNWACGERGLACLPGREAEFRAGVDLALDYARTLKCRRVHCLAGRTPPGENAEELAARYVANIRYAADCFSDIGAQVLIEAINSRIDMPGYWLDTPTKAFDLLGEIARPNVAVQFDVYHAAVMAGDPLPWLERHIHDIGHIQVADYPGRHEPGSGSIAYPSIFARLAELAYGAWIGCEYRPQADTVAGLKWLAEMNLGGAGQ